ncbi:hypothetical protein Droror1_Dr00001011, partial [Drosera rotundifolia]
MEHLRARKEKTCSQPPKQPTSISSRPNPHEQPNTHCGPELQRIGPDRGHFFSNLQHSVGPAHAGGSRREGGKTLVFRKKQRHQRGGDQRESAPPERKPAQPRGRSAHPAAHLLQPLAFAHYHTSPSVPQP